MFDSFGKSAEHYGLESIDFTLVSNIRYQGNSKICGLYCLFGAQTVCKGRDLGLILKEQFSTSDRRINDYSILDWFKKQNYSGFSKEFCMRKNNSCLTYENS